MRMAGARGATAEILWDPEKEMAALNRGPMSTSAFTPRDDILNNKHCPEEEVQSARWRDDERVYGTSSKESWLKKHETDLIIAGAVVGGLLLLYLVYRYESR